MTGDFLERWHQMVDSREPEILRDLIAVNAILRSPTYFRPIEGPAAIIAAFRAVISVIEGLTYKGEWVRDNELVLLFEGKVGDKVVRGIDRVVLNEDGHLSEIEVFVRPLTGLSALSEKMWQALKAE